MPARGANDYLLDEELHDKYPTCYQDGKTLQPSVAVEE
jgi:hypothetical protein